MGLVRAALSEPDRRFIIGQSGGCCNKCKTQVFRENEFAEKARIGDDAHIWAYSNEGPRGSAPGAPADRNDRENIILLCKNCHAEVDQQPIKFAPNVLTTMRREHYAWVDCCLGQNRVQKPRFHHILYLNVPRLDMYAVANSIPIPQFEFDFGAAQRFRDLGFNAGRVMAKYCHVLNDEDMYAHQIGGNDDISHLDAGQYCFIEPVNFRTVEIDNDNDLPAAWASDKCIIYRRFTEWTLICEIQPRWITTSTADSTLRSGWAKLCGVVRISRINFGARKVYVSPLFLAQPEGIFDAN
ncbi:HNH endonuclease [Magnetospirillum molischianum]|uniref:HNH endonuclease n=1 Tax=Magnetospirillum molischianum TaxID=1083 RepID=UPI00058BE99A|nr:HNH endonuclease [Magnetospirillum molischianum]